MVYTARLVSMVMAEMLKTCVKATLKDMSMVLLLTKLAAWLLMQVTPIGPNVHSCQGYWKITKVQFT